MEQIKLKDFLNYRFLSAIQYAPGGQKAAFVVSQANEEDNGYESRLYLYDGQVRPLTSLGKENSFVWLDDEHLLFPAVRSSEEKKRAEKKEQFTSYYVLDLNGGEAQPAFTLPFAARSIKVLAPGRYAVIGTIDANQPDYFDMDAEERAAIDKGYADNKDYDVFDEIPFWFNGAGVINKQRSALFLVTTDPMAMPRVERVTEPLTTVSQWCVLGDEIFFNAETYDARQRVMGCEVCAVNWKTGEKRAVFAHALLALTAILPAGDQLYLTGTTGERHGLNENDWIYTLNPETGDLRVLRQESCCMYGIVGSDCRLGGGTEKAMRGDDLYFITTREGDALLYRMQPSGAFEPVVQKSGSIDCFSANEHNSKVLLIALYDMKLQELYSYDLETGDMQQLTHLNDKVLAGKYVAKPEYLTVESEGLTIGGWVLRPRDFDPAKTYPAVLDVHGGPKTAYGPVFYHEMQLWANMGYFVFYCNPQGSDGRDNDFADIRGKYGTTDFQNLMDFTDAVLKAYPQIDPARVCETGGSYGGFMTNWIIGHTDRFCCTASQRSISNWLSFYGVSDIGYLFTPDQIAGDIYTDPAKLWDRSPLKYAANVKTPTLFIHADEDYRCPLEQGLQMFTALRDQGVESRICVFHGENHELSRSGKPRHRVRRLEEITGWFEKHVR